MEFGHLNSNMTIDGKLYIIPNIDDSKWAFDVLDVYFGDQMICVDYVTRQAYIDNGNTTIQVLSVNFARIIN